MGRKSEFSLYDNKISSFEDDGGAYDQKDAAGFIKLQASCRAPACRVRRLGASMQLCDLKHSPLASRHAKACFAACRGAVGCSTCVGDAGVAMWAGSPCNRARAREHCRHPATLHTHGCCCASPALAGAAPAHPGAQPWRELEQGASVSGRAFT